MKSSPFCGELSGHFLGLLGKFVGFGAFTARPD
jgi:hypothetical protein